MPFITQGKANRKFLFIVAIIASFAAGAIFVWQYLCPLETPIALTLETPTPSPMQTPSPTPSLAIWKPTPTEPIHWQWLISDPFDPSINRIPNVTVYDIDGFDNSADVVSTIHSWGPQYKVICYIDVGGAEPWRPDYGSLPANIIGNVVEGWDENWLDIRQIDILEPIMKARFQMCKEKGFDAIEPDVVDGYANDSGFPLTYQDQINYNKKIAEWTHALGLSVGLKGDIEQVADLQPYFDWTLNEECGRYNECFDSPNSLDSFVSNNKAVFSVEYRENDMDCSAMNSHHINSMLKDLDLTSSGIRTPCLPDTQNNW